jgi:hypothetical protein
MRLIALFVCDMTHFEWPVAWWHGMASSGPPYRAAYPRSFVGYSWAKPRLVGLRSAIFHPCYFWCVCLET